MSETGPPRLDERQRAAVEHGDGPMEVIAGPGAGKTLILVERAALLCDRGTPLSGMVLVTFTTRAAGEMRQRLQVRLGMDVDSRTLRNVSTIHALAYRILRTAKKRTGQPGWRVVDENEAFDALRQLGIARERSTCRKSAASRSAAWSLDGVAQAGVSGFDNSSRRIDMVRLGPAVGLDAGTSGTEYFDAFESRRQSFIGAGTALPEAIFADDFESGGFGYWGANTGVTVTTNASLAPVGTKGMSATLTGATTAKYVTDDVPTSETRYRARFYFDPNGTTMANGADHVMFYGFTGTSTQVLELDLGFTTAGGYRLRTRIRGNATTWNDSPWVNISDAPHMLEVDWQSGTSGSLAWWIDEALQTPPNPIDNGTRRIDRVRLGAVALVDRTTEGELRFDAFREASRSEAQGRVAPLDVHRAYERPARGPVHHL